MKVYKKPSISLYRWFFSKKIGYIVYPPIFVFNFNHQNSIFYQHYKPKQMKRILVFLSLFISFIINAQNYSNLEIDWSEEIKNKGRLGIYIKIKENNFIVGFKGKKIFVDKFTADLKHVSRIEINDYIDEDESFFSIKSFNDQILLFTTHLSKDKSEKVMYVRTYDTKSNKPNATKLELTRASNKKNAKKISLEFVTNIDNNKLAIVVNYSLNKGESLGLFVFNEALELVWKKPKYLITFPDKNYTIKGYAVSASSDFSIIGSVWIKKKEAKQDDLKAHRNYEIISLTNNGDEEIIFPINYEKDIYINDLRLEYDKNDYLNGIGYYSKKYQGGSDGAFVLVIDMLDHSVTEFKKTEFDLDFITEGLKVKTQMKVEKKSIKKNIDYELSNLYLNDIILCDDGSYRLIGEQFYTYTIDMDSDGKTRTITHYVYNDIIVIKLNAQKEFEWNKKIVKRQDRSVTPFSSYSVIETAGELSFIFNDHIDNLEKDPNKNYVNFSFKKKGGVTSIVNIDNDGSLEKKILMSFKDYKRYFAPLYSSSNNKNSMIMCGLVKGKGYFLGKLNFLQ